MLRLLHNAFLARKNAAAPLLVKADLARDQRRWSAAADLYRRYLQIKPDDTSIYMQYGHALKESNQLDAAETAYSFALRRVRDQPDVYLQMAHLAKIRGRVADAIALYRTALELNPELRDARVELEALHVPPTVPPDPLPIIGAVEHMTRALEGRLAGLEERLSPTLNHLSAVLEQLSVVKSLGFRLQKAEAALGSIHSQTEQQLITLSSALAALRENLGRHVDAFAVFKNRMQSCEVEMSNRLEAATASMIPRREFQQFADSTNETARYVIGRTEFVRREILYELQHGRGALEVEVKASIRNGEKVDRFRREGNLSLNIGCGHIPLPDYINVDRRDLPGIDIVAEADALPFGAEEIDTIHSAHLLEHFPQEMLKRRLLPYWFGLLKPGGKLSAVMPDGEAMLMHVGAGSYKFEEFREVLFGAQDYVGDFHYNLLTPDTLTQILADTGFEDTDIVARGRRNGLCYEFEVSSFKP